MPLGSLLPNGLRFGHLTGFGQWILRGEMEWEIEMLGFCLHHEKSFPWVVVDF